MVTAPRLIHDRRKLFFPDIFKKKSKQLLIFEKESEKKNYCPFSILLDFPNVFENYFIHNHKLWK